MSTPLEPWDPHAEIERRDRTLRHIVATIHDGRKPSGADQLYTDFLDRRLLAVLRLALTALGGPHVPPEGFTCDGCELASRCPYAFDAYNTDDDCLLEK